MHYEFFVGPIDLRQRFPELVANSTYLFPLTFTDYYVMYQGRRTQVYNYGERWYSASKEVNAFMDNERPEIISVDRVVQGKWEPNTETNGWISIMVEENKIIGSYYGGIYVDQLGRNYSSNSSIDISPEYRGRGLCREFAFFTYQHLVDLFHMDYILVRVDSTIGAGACRCYVRAAKDLGLRTFGSLSEEHEYLYREVQDCNLGDLKFLIFTTLKVDEVMTSAFDREEEEG
ncbi:Hypothetical protein BRZCDTV_303 [Brazilian cedratvirus IHUMI]|uniref:Acyl-CoA N-acyltransferase n=1 Tax=Brazilian cedratvirus IHUMI TaxID=2126980 RepID=A0A2R8FEF7_9VIRU|nr:Hypothetical protein BRZCDTV_303 [Brazilian cedratvirus IHUMI]